MVGLILIMSLVTKGHAQPYDFSSINTLLTDSSAVYLDRIYVEVFKGDEPIYQYQKGWLHCNNYRVSQGSATKWVSAGIMLKLAEIGYFGLDDSIGTFLPLFTENGKGHITLRDSYSMSSGMFNPGNDREYHRDSKYTLNQSVDSIAKNVDILYPTGEMIGYDGTMMHVWGRAAEIVDADKGLNRDWRTIAKEEFFDLLNMDSTDYTDFLPNPAVAGGIETTPCDYLKFLKMLANGGMYEGQRILSKSSVDEIFTNQTNGAPIYHTYWPSNHPDFPHDLDTMRYTFGGWYEELSPITGEITGVTSPGAFGHYPFVDRCRNLYGTFFCYIPTFKGGGKKVESIYLRFRKLIRDEIGDECFEEQATGTDKISTSSNIYPNPVRTSFRVKTNVPVNQITIHGIDGKMLCQSQQREVVDIMGLEKGVYVAKIEYENGHVSVHKIVKE